MCPIAKTLLWINILIILIPYNKRAATAYSGLVYYYSLETYHDSLTSIKSRDNKNSNLVNLNNSSYWKNTRKRIDYLNYKYLGDLFSYFPFGFFQNLGYFGQPSFVYLFGSNTPSFILNQNELNNRFTNMFNPFYLRDESMDSILIVYPTRSFLFNNSNNIATILFYPFSKRLKKPYSRIKYYQAPNDEGMIDASFNINPMRKVFLSIGINNSSVSPNYLNTDFSLWKTTLNLNYYFSSKILLNFSYNYCYAKTELFGGVEDTIANSQDFGRLLFSPLEASVKFNDRYEKNYDNYFNFNFKYYPETDFNLNFNVYYNSNSSQFRQNENKNNLLNKIINNNTTKTIGAKLKADYHFSNFNLSLLANLEKNNYSLDVYKYFNSEYSYYSSVVAEKNLFNKFNLSVFGKYLHLRNKNILGFGGDLSFNISRGITAYLGYSSFEKPDNIEEGILASQNNGNNKLDKILFAEIKFKNKNLLINLSYLKLLQKNLPFLAFNGTFSEASVLKNYSIFYGDKNFSSLNILTSLSVGNFQLNVNASFNTENLFNALPKFVTKSELFFLDTLFNNNLKIKAGMIYSYASNLSFRILDFQISRQIFFRTNNNGLEQLRNPYPITLKGQFDFFFAGNIRNRAIIYFAIENVLDFKYYILPFYPMPGRTFRFGIKWDFFN